ncbi:MCE family protein [Mycobacterium intracellulare]|uniref:MCE family protein n=1 Tax=Mycobacterium intracellulare TaxID=1767 RepID=UPI00080B88E5|nr:MlaD family protein [Mycobacterium intracellulare]OCB22482.1 mammalian cell entry protein [Mycobacterium intracellulare subsp. yongonense]
MRLNKRTKIQLSIFAVVAVVAGTIMAYGYIRVPAMLGWGRYNVTVDLPRAGGLYEGGNVTYRGTEVGKVTAVRLHGTGVQAELSLRSDVPIPSNLDAQVHSTSAIGEQYVALLPRSNAAPPLKNGDVIPLSRTSVPPEIGSLLDAANRGLQAIPRDNVKTVIDESYTAIGGLGPELSRIVKGSTQLAIDSQKNLDAITTLIDQSQPVLNSQAQSADSIKSWASHLASLTGQLKNNDASVAGLIEKGGPAFDQARQLVDRLQPTLPVIMSNLVGISDLALVYNASIEELLVLLPMGVQIIQASDVANKDSKHPGFTLNFNLNLNLPPPCTTGFLPATQQRNPSMQDTPTRPVDDLYCRIPQDSWNAVRGARNLPCIRKPGKRAPSAKMCNSDEQYVPLNDGFNWKGDPNATYTGQDLPQVEPGAQPPGTPPSPPAPTTPPVAVSYYDPATGTYVAPDGHVYTQSELSVANKGDKTWQSMLTPPSN